MRKFTRDELNRIPELKHLEVVPRTFGGYRGSMFDYRRKVALGETTIAGLTQDESIAAVDQATNMRIAGIEAFEAECARAENRHTWTVLGFTAVTVVVMVAISLFTFFGTSSTQANTVPGFQYVRNILMYLAAIMILVGALAGVIYSMCRPR